MCLEKRLILLLVQKSIINKTINKTYKVVMLCAAQGPPVATVVCLV